MPPESPEDTDATPDTLTDEEVRALLRAKVLRAAQLLLRDPPQPPTKTV